MKNQKIFALVLAAGSSSRFGGAKQLAGFRGTTLIRSALDTAESTFAERTLLILGNAWRPCLGAIGVQQGFFVINDRPERGMSQSIRLGVRALSDAADAIVITLCDQPLVTAGHLAALAAAWDGSPSQIVCSEAGGFCGPPALFASNHFHALCELEGDRGARALIADHADSVRSVTFEAAAVDVDTSADLERLT